MALSFEESKKLLAKQTAATPAVMSLPSNDVGIMTLAAEDEVAIAAYSEWTKSDKYDWYDEYTDDNTSTVDKNKNITVDASQINISQEENSQFIPFEMPRYYDGFDLMDTEIWFYYESSDGIVGSSRAVNVSYDTATIKFGWLVDGNATHVAGDLKLEIRAIGVNSKGNAYVWKTKTFERMKVLQSLINDRVIKLDESWVQELVERVAESVATKIGELQVEDQVAAAEAAADRAETAADRAETTVTNALKDYYTKTEVNNYVQEQIDAIPEVDLSGHALKSELPTALSELENDVGYLTEHQSLDGYATEDYVLDEIAKVDVSDQLQDYALKTYVDDAVAAVDVSEQLADYAKSADVYTKTEVDNKDTAMSSSINTNTENISALSGAVEDLQAAIGAMDNSPRITYEATYGSIEAADGSTQEYMFTLWETDGDNDPTVKSQFQIAGGGGGGASSSNTLYISFDKDENGKNISSYVFTADNVADDEAILYYDFSGVDPVGDSVSYANATWQSRKGTSGQWTNIATETIYPGEDIAFNVSDYIYSDGTYQFKLNASDDTGAFVSKVWTIQQITLKVESNFDDKLTYPIGPVSFTYTPYGAISKDIYFVLDGEDLGVVTTTSSGIPTSYELPVQEHGAHLLEMYMKANINGKTIESNHVVKDIIWYDATSTVPVIGTVYQEFEARQYDATNIEYTVYDPTTEAPTVEIAVDGVIVSTPTLTTATNVYAYKTDVVGNHIITITCNDVVKTLKANITKLDINVAPITAGLVFDFNPSGRSNNDADRVWTNGTVSMTVSDNFDWVNGGYQYDANGDQYFCVKAGTFATINHNLFADDAKASGKEFKVVFKTENIKRRDTTFISCMNGGIGLDMKVENANIYSSNGSLYSPYCEEDIIEFEFNINKSTDIPMVLTYEDGVGNRPMIYTADSSFWQQTPQPITIGSADCDVHIYRMKAYNSSLTDSNILANFIADARNADEMVSRYNRNQIYDENNLLDPEVLAEKCPDLRIIMIDAPWFTNDKDNKVDDTTIRMIYKNGDPVLDNWRCTGARHSGQGTSSNEYGYAGRNIDLIMDTDTSLFTLGDNTTTSKTITLTRNSVPTDYLNVKVNIASSENQNNAQMARRYNEFNPFVRSAKFNDPKVKDCMEFYNCVIFVKERDENIADHREFLDTNYHFYAIGNVGDSKKTDDTRVNDKNDPKECVVEIADYNVKLAEFPTGNPDGICAPADWKAGNIAYDYLYAPYKYKDGKFKSFGSDSYEFRYEMKGITEEQREVNINAWRDMYKFVVTSTDEEFHRDLKKYFVVDSALYYYLFTERYTMVDNRAKNSFWHYGKVYITTAETTTLGEVAGGFVVDDEQAAFNDGYRWDLSFGYDFDTSLGIDNTGKLVLTYGKEDTDYYVDGDPSSAYIYRAAESTFFCRLRDLFTSEMQAMFVDRENANAWSSNGLISQWDNAQNQFPEELWRLDIQRKYLRTYQGVSIDNSIAGTANPRFLTEMLNGRKRYQRRMFERNQELYMATKYFGKTATQDQIMMRFNNPETYVVKPDFTLYLTPYSDMYIGVSFYNGHKENFRAKAGVKYTVNYPEGLESADITLIYGASFIQAIDDLSKCYIGDNDFSKASRLQSLIIGSGVTGYANSYMKKISLGNNKLLEYLDIRNIAGLNSVVDLSQCGNMLELYAQGSGATGVIFANGGKLQKAHIPAVTSLTMKNLNYIQEFVVESYNKLQSLVVEYTPFIDTHEVVTISNMLNTLRLIGINWEIPDTAILDRILSMRGYDNTGKEIETSVLTGAVHTPSIKQQKLREYNEAWQDLDITYNDGGLILQHPVTFVNDDGTVLEIQYVDEGGYAVDPVTRADNPIATPTKASTISTEYTYSRWDNDLTSRIFEATVVRAVYAESVRKYTVKYVVDGKVRQETRAEYGSYVNYNSSTPTIASDASSHNFFLFNRWDKSGFVDGDKTITAIFDNFKYQANSFTGRKLSDLRPVEIYALSKMTEPVGDEIGNYGLKVATGDDYTFTMGYDVDYDDVESEEIIVDGIYVREDANAGVRTVFDGTNYIDTGITLFDEDKDFILALDYKVLSGNSTNSTLVQCYETAGENGFKLYYQSSPVLSWGGKATATNNETVVPSDVGNREMMVIRHRHGDNNLYIYVSELQSTDIKTYTMPREHATTSEIASLVFGAAKMDNGRITNYGKGEINWCKIWYMDFGEAVCKQLVSWPHEKITLEVDGFYRYQLHDDTTKESMMSLLATHLLSVTGRYNLGNYENTGGWASSYLNKYLNSRFYNAIPYQIKALMKKVSVKSTIGDNSSMISSSGCYVNVPALYDLYDDAESVYHSELYEGATTIDFFTGAVNSNGVTNRARDFDGEDWRDGGVQYWTRSPAIGSSSNNYCYTISAKGSPTQFVATSSKLGILIEISF